ncbi:MAG: glutathione S-transferase family protein [Alsobacter sp.]
MALTIYGIARTRTSRVLWMAEELGIPYRHEKLAPAAGDTRTPAFLAINPMARVPAIDEDGLVVTESMAINLHLARAHGGPLGLGPRDVGEEALMTQWSIWAVAEFEPNAHEVLVHTLNLPPAERDAARRDAALAALRRPLAALETALIRGGGHLVGGRFTVADLNVACVAFYLRAADGALAAFPATTAWYAAATARPAYARMMALRDAG